MYTPSEMAGVADAMIEALPSSRGRMFALSSHESQCIIGSPVYHTAKQSVMCERVLPILFHTF